MKCPKCETNNPEMRKFCRECGAKLLRLCPKCDSENLPEDKFCGECGQKLDQAVREKDVLEAEGDDTTILTRGLHVQGVTQMRMGKYEEAVPFLQRAMEITESIPDYIVRSEIGALLGQCYLYEEEHQKALEILEESERINTEHRIPIPMTNLMHSFAEVYLAFAEKEKKNKTDWMHKARYACKQALKAGKGSKAKLPHTAR